MLMIRPWRALHHRPGGGAGEQERAPQVDVDHRVPLLVLHADDHVVAGDAGVVDQHVQLAPQLDDLIDHFADAVAVGHVAGDRFGRAAGGANGGHGVGQAFGVDVDAGHLGPGRGQRLGDAAPQAARGPGHQRHLSVQVGRNSTSYVGSATMMVPWTKRIPSAPIPISDSQSRIPNPSSHTSTLWHDALYDRSAAASRGARGRARPRKTGRIPAATGNASSLPTAPAGESAEPGSGGSPPGRRAARRRRWKSRESAACAWARRPGPRHTAGRPAA